MWRKPERFSDFLLACKADARGRTTFEYTPYKQADYIWQAYECALKVDIKAIIEKGHKGPAIKDQLNQQRILAINEFKKSYKNKD